MAVGWRGRVGEWIMSGWREFVMERRGGRQKKEILCRRQLNMEVV